MTTPVQRWSALHHGIDPARVPLLLPWLRATWWLARPLVAVPPTAITLAGVLLALDAVLLAGPLPGAAVPVVLAAGLCDALDGAVAVLAGRATKLGAVADAVADRVADLAFAAVLWRCGVPWLVALGCGGLAVGVDGMRRVRRLPARITVAERPTFVVCAALGAGSAALSSAGWPVLVCAAVWLAACALALTELAAS